MIRRRAGMESEKRDQMRGGTGTVTVTHCFKPAEFAAKMRLCARLTIPPGASIGMHQHEGEDEVYIVLRGAGIVSDGATDTAVVEGDAVLTGRGESHAVRNTGTTDLEMVAVIAKYA